MTHSGSQNFLEHSGGTPFAKLNQRPMCSYKFRAQDSLYEANAARSLFRSDFKANFVGLGV